jgi:predicted dinucleotide-utilizing enzyme
MIERSDLLFEAANQAARSGFVLTALRRGRDKLIIRVGAALSLDAFAGLRDSLKRA